MAQDIALLNAVYSDVPAVQLPKDGGGTATFTDVSDTTAAAADVLSGKYFYTAAGVRTAGTGSGGGGVNLDDFFSRTAPATISLPTTTTLYGFSFYEDDVVTSISAPSVTRIGAYDFARCDNLETVTMPELLYAGVTITQGTSQQAGENIGNSAECFVFVNCDKLKTIHLPKLLKAGKGLFYQCGYNTNTTNCVVVLPSVTQLGHSACRQGKFVAVDLGPNLNTLNNDAFYNAAVGALILRSPTVVSAGNRDAVRHIKNLYVPSALVASYATASNWSTDSAGRTVTAIEGSQYENYYADGTPIT